MVKIIQSNNQSGGITAENIISIGSVVGVSAQQGGSIIIASSIAFIVAAIISLINWM